MHTAIDLPLEKVSREMMSLQRCGKEEYMYERKQSERKGRGVSERETVVRRITLGTDEVNHGREIHRWWEQPKRQGKWHY